MDSESLEQQADRIYRQAEERKRKEEGAWHVLQSLERTALNTVGCWEMLKSEVNFAYFHAAGPDAPPLQDNLPKKMRKAAEKLGVRWPHDLWSNAADGTSTVRHKLAHLLYVDSIEGRRPHRTLSIVRMGAPGEPREAKGEHPRGLSWRHIPDPDTEPEGVAWSQMTMHRDTITEDELADTLGAMRFMRDCCHTVQYLGSVANEIKPRAGLRLPEHTQDMIPWWLPEWGDREAARLTWGDVLEPAFYEETPASDK